MHAISDKLREACSCMIFTVCMGVKLINYGHSFPQIIITFDWIMACRQQLRQRSDLIAKTIEHG